MERKKPTRRKPDGSPELRNVDGLLRNAVSSLEKARESARRYHNHIVLLATLLPAYLGLPPIHFEARKKEIREEFPQLPPLPEDLKDRLRARFCRARPSLWKHLGAFW